jgi:hypothetical protein
MKWGICLLYGDGAVVGQICVAIQGQQQVHLSLALELGGEGGGRHLGLLGLIVEDLVRHGEMK